ncbi:MAG: hypothetical protein CML17_06405 [Pusillimonas sp.]|jgi:hypothetical protein|nr:hypothetical protein [Pusillimonas sp.]
MTNSNSAHPKNYPSVTLEEIESNIGSEHYFTGSDGIWGAYKNNNDVRMEQYKPDHAVSTSIEALGLLTFCVIVLRNGFTVIGESACVSPENFNAEKGREVARKNAIEKMWPLMGYALKTKLSEERERAERRPDPADGAPNPGVRFYG